MRPTLLFKLALLLILSQAVLGATGFLTASWPWPGLLLLLLFGWLIYRVGRVLREEMARVPERVGLVPWRTALFVAVLWQVPAAILTLAINGFDVTGLWHGAMLPLTGALGSFWPDLPPLLHPWLWLTALLQMGLFVAAAAEPVVARALPKQVVAKAKQAAGGEWVAARTAQDAIKARRKRVKQ